MRNLEFRLKTNKDLDKSLKEIEESKTETIDNINERSHSEDRDSNIDYYKLINLNGILIVDAFSDKKYLSFRRFSRRVRISSVSEITSDILVQYGLFPRVGKKSVFRVKERLKDIINTDGNIFSVKFENRNIPFSEVLEKIGGLLAINKEYDISIQELYYDNRLRVFVELCNDYKIHMISQLTNEVVEAYYKLPRVGKYRIILVNEILREYLTTIKEQKKNNENMALELKSKWYDTLKDVQLSEIAEILDITLDDSFMFTFSEIQGKTHAELGTINNKKSIIDMLNKLNNLGTIEEIFNDLSVNDDKKEKYNKKKKLSERELKCINLKIGEGYTLERIGDEIEVTPERVRQIIAKAVKKIEKLVVLKDIKLAIKLTFLNRNYCHLDEFYFSSGDKNKNLVKVFLKECKFVSVSNSLGILYFEEPNDL